MKNNEIINLSEDPVWQRIISGEDRPIMQPGEGSWASWKCGGGPHTKDFEPSHARPPQETIRRLGQIVPYSGTEGVADCPVAPQRPTSFIVDIPA